ncbi:MAG: NAD(P)H-dependent oxidoreductase [Akkermansiaceae bacterium]|nr:NAD(P)H-dependent oxidoreductase [Akkermansiaceae bacterium]
MSKTSPQDLIDQLQWRYATKKFDVSKTIPDKVWSVIASSLVLTPSSFGLQPWHFVAIRDQKIKEELLAHSWGQAQVTDCSHFVVLTAKTSMTEAEIDSFLARTIEIRGGKIDQLNPYRDMMVGFTKNMDEAAKLQWAKLQTYIALGQLMTTAALLGVDACPMEGIAPTEYDRILGLEKKGLTTSVACALGYRCSEDKYANAPKVRFDESDILTLL